jgi:hypothetical protein
MLGAAVEFVRLSGVKSRFNLDFNFLGQNGAAH